ncbi:hypothetical protein AVR91_0211930 [Amycolatopsis keratiniphila subsp. keratiniphila]|uniref:HTH cro/C1-type domain-containing protein n=1 Tax=Amycolatopsis keratiniphila subsp. keratiniphila TaxID=227715 RepID=A0A1W2LWW8_9PSEU|nr:hypothetical protein AVR91_0211930 [Amycolatopsis keratiniphila subsp. keratiniphila]
MTVEECGRVGTRAFGEFLRLYRLRSSMTQEELAERTGISVRAISYMERGRVRTPQRRTVELLSEGLGLTHDEHREFADAGRAGRRTSADTDNPDLAGPLTSSCALPPELTELTGRDADLEALERYALESVASCRLQLAVVHGLPGSGKTALVVKAAHRLKESFADGCLYLDLRGTDRVPLTTDRAVRQLLHAFGLDERVVPNDPDNRLSLYRSLLRDRTVLLVLDNAADEAQVRPLLATSNGTLVLVSSRNTLTGLDVRHRIGLDRLTPDDAVELLGLVAGQYRVAAEPEEARRVAALCGGIPLALIIAGNRLASRTQWPISYLADRLEDERRRLSVLTAGDLQVRTAFEISYHHLDPDAASMFRRLALVPGSEVSIELAAVVSGQPEETAELSLEKLADASLLTASGTCGRYTCHDLLRVFARERLEREENVEATQDALVRTRHWLLDVATKAALYFDHDRTGVGAVDGPDPVYDRQSATGWLEAERSSWRCSLRTAAAQGEHRRVLDLAAAMHWYSDLRGDGELWCEVFGAGATAARALGDRRAEAEQSNFLCWALSVLCGKPYEALEVHDRAVAAATEVGDLVLEAWAYYYRSAIDSRLTLPADAVRHNRRAVALFEQADYPTGQYLSMSWLGKQLHMTGEFDEAVTLHRRCVAHYRDQASTPGNDELLSMVLTRYAETLAALGDLSAALPVLDEAEALFRKHGAVVGVARVQHRRGQALLHSRRLAEATDQLLSAFRLLADNRWSDDRVRILEQLSEIYEQRDEPGLAREYRIQALTECTRYETPANRETARKLAGLLGVGEAEQQVAGTG